MGTEWEVLALSKIQYMIQMAFDILQSAYWAHLIHAIGATVRQERLCTVVAQHIILRHPVHNLHASMSIRINSSPCSASIELTNMFSGFDVVGCLTRAFSSTHKIAKPHTVNDNVAHFFFTQLPCNILPWS